MARPPVPCGRVLLMERQIDGVLRSGELKRLTCRILLCMFDSDSGSCEADERG